MSPFSRSAPKPQTAQDFINEPDRSVAITGEVAPQFGAAKLPLRRNHLNPDVEKKQETDALSEPPWAKHNKAATAKNVFNLRLNDYYLAMLRHAAELEGDKSMQRIVKEILLPELERRAIHHSIEQLK